MLERHLFETHFNLIPFHVYLVDTASYEIIFMNTLMKEDWGDLTGQICYEKFMGKEEPCEFCQMECLITKQGLPNTEIITYEFFNEVDDNWYQAQAKAMGWVDGRIVKYNTVFNITNLKETQSDLAEAHANLALKKKELERISTTDKLTGIANRLRLDKRLEQEFERAGRYNNYFSIIMADIDHFKLVNDTHGHQTGDQVLREMAGLLADGIRNVDLVGRWGGEEFLVVLPETRLKEGLLVAERLRSAVERFTFTQAVRQTASFGVAQHCDSHDLEQTIKRADAALYRAKKTGRNRVVGAEGV